MNPGAEEALREVIQEYGTQVCHTPRMVEALLSKKLRPWPAEMKALSAAANFGVLKEILTKPQLDEAKLTEQLAKSASMGMPMAKWSVATWRKVIADVNNSSSPALSGKSWNEMPVSGDIGEMSAVDRKRAIVATIILSLIGCIAGALPGLLVGIGLSHRRGDVDIVRSKTQQAMNIKSGAPISTTQFMGVFSSMGAFGGLFGAGMGLMIGIKQLKLMRYLGGMIAAGSSFMGVIAGMTAFGPIGAVVGAFLYPFISVAVFVRMGLLVGFGILIGLAFVLNVYFELFKDLGRVLSVVAGG